jgi:glycogen(starch) synthase
VRILYWTDLFFPYIGGVEVLSARFLPAMRARGHELTVVTSHGGLDLPDVDEWEGFPVHRFPLRRALAERDIEAVVAVTRGVAALKRERRPELVHVRMTDPSVFFHLRTRDAHPCPTLVCVCVELPPGGAGPGTMVGSMLGSAEWVVGVSEAMLADVHRLAPEARERSSVIHEAQVAPDLPPAPLPLDPPTVLCLGRVVPEKGFDVALDALARVRERVPGVRLVVAGDGPERAPLEARARDLGLAGAVQFRGWVAPEDVPALVNEATVVAMPSRWQEAFGLVAVEAALMERPVVATRVGGLTEAVLDGETGIVVPSEDVPAFAGALLELLRDPDRAAAMGRAGRARARRYFDHDDHVSAYEEIYQRLAS